MMKLMKTTFLFSLFFLAVSAQAASPRIVDVGACNGMPDGGAAVTSLRDDKGLSIQFEIDSKGKMKLPSPAFDGWEYTAGGDTGHALVNEGSRLELFLVCND